MHITADDLPPPVPRPTVRLREDVFTRGHLRALGHASLSDLAITVGLSHTTLLRARDGAVCGDAVIGALIHHTGLQFEDLFRITT